MNEFTLIQTADQLRLMRNGQELPLVALLQICPESRVYALHGQMGAGKTTFMKALMQEMGVEDVVNSPTFAIVNVYSDADGNDIYHFDCYRLKSLREAFDMGTEDYLNSGSYCFIEWPDIIADLLPDNTVHISFTVNDKDSRTLVVEQQN